ncbi:hypothetical protein F5Y16DRAFT_372023 [Xylariaceae sp. FL0255]|nr:hypothetical protein F5Y16DRAFT_372023 [Xylariaceae sp. FL0255]
MSFGFGGGGGFGTNNNNNTTSGFGGFGTNNNTTGGFGATNNNATSGFGANNNTGGGGLFGGGGTSTFGGGTTSAFGTSGNTGAFGAKPSGFGATSTAGGGLFGGGATTATTSSPFGGFGNNTTNNNTTSSPFGGGGGAGSSLFGNSTANKPVFGSSTTGTTGGGLFGSGTGTTGTTSTFGGFGATANNPASTALGPVGDPPGTANITNFSPLVEKENTTSNAQNSFQNILFQDPYKKWSAEELRMVDYAGGRRFGGASGSNTFGVGSNFGGFGANTQTSTPAFGNTTTNTTGGGLFGNNNTTGGGFGQTNTTTNAFGNSTGGGLFGAKPATTGAGGLFGNTATSQPAAAGGLFGTAGNTGFGNNTTTTNAFGTTNNNAGGLFGANNNAAAQPKTGFSFGTTNTNTGGGFGTTNNNAGGGLFGNNAATTTGGGGLFGNNQQQTTGGFGNTGGAFGTQNQQQAGTGLFGNTQQKPAGTGLFGASTTTPAAGGGLFGANNNAGGFGQQNNAQTGAGGLFGNKPATGSTGGLFGSSTTQNTNTAGGGLFGGLGQNNQQQQSQQGGLFGQNQQKPSLFGAPAQSTGGGLFGTSQNTMQQASPFGASSTQQPQNNMGNSLFGASQGAQSNVPSLTASINDPSAYGSLFGNLGNSEMSNPGPLATPTGKRQARRPSILPYYKLTASSASRFATPQKRGYGFSYSTYGTPNSPSSAASTPGAMSQSLMLGGSLSRNLGKSVSANNLRRSFNIEDSVLLPGAFSASSGPRGYNNGSVKKLVINKELRSDLFSTPTHPKDKPSPETPNTARKLSKRVSFDTGGVQAIEDGSAANGSPSSTPTAEELGYVRPKNTNGVNGLDPSATPEMEQVKGNELAVVHEDEAPAPVANTSTGPQLDGEPGDYWMSPTKEEIQNMNRVQRQRVANFTVGRHHIGRVEFQIPVDLTTVDIDSLFNNVVILEPRTATVYPNPAKKPAVGKGLNVPSLITLENAFPRASRTGKAISINKHIERLKKIAGTKFLNYDVDTGEWSFTVDHFTTYGLDESEDEDDVEAPPASTAQFDRAESASPVYSDQDNVSSNRQSLALPGAFETEDYSYHDEPQMGEAKPKPSFLASRSAGSTSQALVRADQGELDDEYAMSEVNDASDHQGHHLAAEQEEDSFERSQSDLAPETPAGIMRARMRAIKNSAVPMKVQVAAGDDWMDMLSKTISPQKRDRALLRSIHEADAYRSVKDGVRDSPTKKRIVSDGKGFATSIDLMNSLFEQAKVPAENYQASVRPKGVKWPYKRVTKNLDESKMDSADRTWHDTMRPTWGPSGTLIFCNTPSASTFSRSGRITEKNGLMTVMKGGIVSETQDIRIAKFANEMSAKAIDAHSKLVEVHLVDGVPTVEFDSKPSLKDFFARTGSKNSAGEHERLVWELASVLFDHIKVPADLQGDPEALERIRRDNLSKFWESMVEERTTKAIAMAGSHEEKALAALSGHRIAEACKHLLEGKNFRLASLTSLIGANDSVKKDVKEQIQSWWNGKVISEITPPIRALYEMLSGNVCACEGKKGAAEDRIDSFVISQKFGLNWQQAFGLRLWYAISTSSPIAEAVERFWEDVEQDKELYPDVWFAQNGIPCIWNDPEKGQRADLLWGLLRLYSDDATDLESVIRPENSQLSPLDYRLCWQLGQALTSTGHVSFGRNSSEKADAATTSFAAQLTNEGSWLEATFVLLHLSDSDSRTRAIQDHLCRHAALIGNDDLTAFKRLAGELMIPTPWIWHAKALYMRSAKKDAAGEVQCLLRAGSWAEAHHAFVMEVAPKFIIERDYDALADVLQQFEGRHSLVLEWNAGGAVYKSFLQLMGLHRRHELPSQQLVDSLLEGLPAMHGNTPEAGVIEYAALTEMAAEVAEVVMSMTKLGQADHDRILQLPLTEDMLLKHSKDLAWSHYNAVMAGH